MKGGNQTKGNNFKEKGWGKRRDREKKRKERGRRGRKKGQKERKLYDFSMYLKEIRRSQYTDSVLKPNLIIAGLE